MNVQSRFTDQIRAAHPAPLEEPHPRAAEMAAVMSDIIARDGGVTYAEIRHNGFTDAEIIEHEQAARLILTEAVVLPEGDRVPQVTQKAIDAITSRMPVMSGNMPTPEQRRMWSAYCLARAALTLDAWPGQLRRCETLLLDFLATLPMLESERERIRSTVWTRITRKGCRS